MHQEHKGEFFVLPMHPRSPTLFWDRHLLGARHPIGPIRAVSQRALQPPTGGHSRRVCSPTVSSIPETHMYNEQLHDAPTSGAAPDEKHVLIETHRGGQRRSRFSSSWASRRGRAANRGLEAGATAFPCGFVSSRLINTKPSPPVPRVLRGQIAPDRDGDCCGSRGRSRVCSACSGRDRLRFRSRRPHLAREQTVLRERRTFFASPKTTDEATKH